MNKNKSNKKRGFTLIELIVVMAVIGILTLLAVPKFIGYTREAKLVKLQHNIKVVEDAAEMYHLHNEDWPRLTDVPYSAEELQELAEKYLDETGEVLELDPNGNYYNIDWDKMKSYIKKPHDAEMYVLQNPVGEVFYMEDLTPKGQERVDILQGKEVVEDSIEFMIYINSNNGTPEDMWSYKGGEDILISAEFSANDYGYYDILINNEVVMSNYLVSEDNPYFYYEFIMPYEDIYLDYKLVEKLATDSSYFEFDRRFGEITGYSYAGPESVVIPREIDGVAVESVGLNAFRDSAITSVVIPDSVTAIGDNAFLNNQLTEVVIPDSVITIGRSAFRGNQLTEVVIPDSVTFIGNYAFIENGPLSNSSDLPTSTPGTYILNGTTWQKQ